MGTFKIITNTTADLPMDYIRENQLGLIYFNYMMDGVSYGKDKELDWKKFYRLMREEEKITHWKPCCWRSISRSTFSLESGSAPSAPPSAGASAGLSHGRTAPGSLSRLHAKCVEEVKRINGAVDFKDAYRYQRREN